MRSSLGISILGRMIREEVSVDRQGGTLITVITNATLLVDDNTTVKRTTVTSRHDNGTVRALGISFTARAKGFQNKTSKALCKLNSSNSPASTVLSKTRIRGSSRGPPDNARRPDNSTLTLRGRFFSGKNGRLTICVRSCCPS